MCPSVCVHMYVLLNCFFLCTSLSSFKKEPTKAIIILKNVHFSHSSCRLLFYMLVRCEDVRFAGLKWKDLEFRSLSLILNASQPLHRKWVIWLIFNKFRCKQCYKKNVFCLLQWRKIKQIRPFIFFLLENSIECSTQVDRRFFRVFFNLFVFTVCLRIPRRGTHSSFLFTNHFCFEQSNKPSTQIQEANENPTDSD